MKRPNPDTVSPGAFNGVSARAAARQDHGQPRLPPEPAGRTRCGRPGASVPRAGHPRLPGSPLARREARREDQDPARARRHASDERLARRASGRRKCRARRPRQCRAHWPWPQWPWLRRAGQLWPGVPASPGHAEPASYVRAVPAGRGYAVPAGHGCAGPAAGSARPQALAGPVAPAAPAATAAPARTATPAVPARPAAPAAPAGPAGAAVRAVIGDQLRMPVMWCEMGSCVSWHADPAALGEADTRARAIDAGWRIDALGRLACPRCQQTDPGFRAARPVVPWDRYMAIARTAGSPPCPASRPRSLRSSRDPGRAASGYPPASRAELERHHDSPADEAMPAGRTPERPASTCHSRGAVLNAARAWRACGGRQAAPRQGQ